MSDEITIDSWNPDPPYCCKDYPDPPEDNVTEENEFVCPRCGRTIYIKPTPE